jgi:hypothetical protein
MSFTWTAEQREQAVAGATVCVSGSPTYDAGRYTITGQLDGFLLVVVNGVNASVPWARADPSTLSVEDSRQMGLF